MHRDRSLDFLRGTAIFFMISTHAIGVFYNGNNPIIEWISWWGGTVCFTIFLFVFAAVYGLKLHKGTLDTKHELKRALLILGAYYFIALWVYVFGVWKFGPVDQSFWRDIRSIFQLEKLIYFTEFVIAFVGYIVFIALLQRPLLILLKRPLLGIVAGLGGYGISSFLYSLSWDHGLVGIVKEHLVGNGDIHSFPLLAYLPVVMLGLLWGYWLRQEGFDRWRRAKQGGLVLLGIWVVLHSTGWIPPDRFPPTLLFLSYGLAFCFIALAIFNLLEKIRWIERPLFFVGKHAFSFYFLHILIMIPLGTWLVTASSDIFRLVFLFGVVMLAISGVITAKSSLRRN